MKVQKAVKQIKLFFLAITISMSPVSWGIFDP
jgi:hypothetical protein